MAKMNRRSNSPPLHQKAAADDGTAAGSLGTKRKRTRKSNAQRECPPQRSSVYRGVTRHRWTGRFEAHLWDKNIWNESQNKKGKQVYLGAYDDEETAAHAYDLAALKYWGSGTVLNFPLSTYLKEIKEMENQSREEYIGYLRRKSSGFSRGASKYRGVARHHHNGRWEARIGRVLGNKYLYLGTYATQEEAATAYDIAAIEYRGLNAVTNFDLSRYIKWIRPSHEGFNADPTNNGIHLESPAQSLQQNEEKIAGEMMTQFPDPRTSAGVNSSALGLLLQSTKFKEMLEKASAESSSTTTTTSSSTSTSTSTLTSSNNDAKPSKCSFPDYIQTYFECQDNASLTEEEDSIFGGLSSFASPLNFEI